ncbi:MAG: CBS domain-containing protein [Caulobacteraceae bacterium]
MKNMKIKEIMTTDVKTVTSSDNVSQAASVMDQLNVGSIPVIDNNKVVGIVTDRDIVVRSVAKGQNPTQKVSDVMTTNITYATPDMDVHKAADIMAEQQIRRLPVVENGSLVGIVAIGDLAVENIFENEAGEALHDISKGVRH